MNRKSIHWLISSEHASNSIPEKWYPYFDHAGQALESHLGWDPGSVELANVIAEKKDVKPHIFEWSRLLIEPNRSLHHPALFSEFTKLLEPDQKEELIQTYWQPYRDRIRDEIRNRRIWEKVIHISVHTFTPVFNGQSRDFEIGLLYDPKRKPEQRFCSEWKKDIEKQLTGVRVRMNLPYKGASDGLTTALRKEFDENEYLGIELEVNQKAWFEDKHRWRRICQKLADSIYGIQL